MNVTHKLYEIPGLHRGRIAVMPRPRGSEWLSDSLTGIKAEGVGTIVSLLPSYEIEKLDISQEPIECARQNIRFFAFPIHNFSVPERSAAFISLAEELLPLFDADEFIAIHCRMGIGRSGMLAAYLLCRLLSITVDDAFARITSVRGQNSPDTPEQKDWIQRLVDTMETPKLV